MGWIKNTLNKILGKDKKFSKPSVQPKKPIPSKKSKTPKK